MHTGLGEDAELLRGGLREVLAAEDGVGVARDLVEGVAPRRDLFAALAGIGVTGLLVAESRGGLGLGELEVVVVAEELGRVVAAVPFASTTVAATTLLDGAPEAASTCEAIAAGSLRVAVAQPSGQQVRVRAGSCGWVADGAVAGVADLVAADLVLVVVDLEGSGSAVVALDPGRTGVHRDASPTLDPTSPRGTLRLDGVEVGEADVLVQDAAAVVATARQRSLLVAAADAVGVGAAALGLGVTEARTHEQFGRPIGAFQAVAHPLVDAWADVERARSLTCAAAAATVAGRSNARHLAVCARVLAVPAARRATETAIQVHGAIGYTFDHDLHLYYRRARAAEHDRPATSTHEQQAVTLAGW